MKEKLNDVQISKEQEKEVKGGIIVFFCDFLDYRQYCPYAFYGDDIGCIRGSEPCPCWS